MSSANAALPGFKIDPDTGKYVPVPYNISDLFPDARTKRPNQEWSNPRKCSDTHSIQPAKFRKTETGVRKELFKHPVRNNEKVKELIKDTKNKNCGVRKSLMRSLPFKNDLKAPINIKQEPSESSQMVTIKEESEQIVEPTNNKGYHFKSLITPQIKFSATTREYDVKTPESFESNANFLRLELLCKSPMVKNESPVSTVCNLFQSNMLLNSEKKNVNSKNSSKNEIITEIRRTIGRNQEIYQETSAKIKEIVELQERHEENIRVMSALVDKLQGASKESSSQIENDEEKENSSAKRRSLRLQNKSPPAANIARPAGSPVILKAGDLRKSTLTKGLVSKYQKYQIDSPRIQKAMDMYNTTRSACSALCTPKVSRVHPGDSPTTSNWRSNLSLKVQQQCLLLQDTPVHK